MVNTSATIVQVRGAVYAKQRRKPPGPKEARGLPGGRGPLIYRHPKVTERFVPCPARVRRRIRHTSCIRRNIEKEESTTAKPCRASFFFPPWRPPGRHFLCRLSKAVSFASHLDGITHVRRMKPGGKLPHETRRHGKAGAVAPTESRHPERPEILDCGVHLRGR